MQPSGDERRAATVPVATVPVNEVCYFYGKSGLLRAIHPAFRLKDTGGNQCALAVQRLSPCYMQVRGQHPEEARCPIIAALLTWRIR